MHKAKNIYFLLIKKKTPKAGYPSQTHNIRQHTNKDKTD